jgi:hypothetical protein
MGFSGIHVSAVAESGTAKTMDRATMTKMQCAFFIIPPFKLGVCDIGQHLP